VTNAGPWSSHHQYGVAGDFVLFIHGNWSWDDTGERRQRWAKLHEFAHRVGLEPLSWERPHLQLRDVSLNAHDIV
jgi:peptidoglycan L-alanyl-D-glutamate endopeptidase CwlK